MANMSYCRFRNTLTDLRDCVAALREDGLGCTSSTSEDDARESMVAVARKFVALHEELMAEEAMDEGDPYHGAHD
jgi:hypothetical protein